MDITKDNINIKKNSKSKNININKIKKFNCMKLTGNKRRRQSKNDMIEDAEENAKKEFDTFFNDKMRQKEKEEKIGLKYIKENCKEIFYNVKKNNKVNNKNEKKLEENNKDNKDNKDTNTFYDLIKDNWEKEISILDIVFLKYLKECSSLSNKNYFYFIVQFIVSLRNYLQEKKVKGKNKNIFIGINETELVPEYCNDYFLIFLKDDPLEKFTLKNSGKEDKEKELIKLTKHLSYWLYKNGYNKDFLV